MKELVRFLDDDRLRSRAIDLVPFGVNNYAWERGDAISVIDRLQQLGMLVLGGDVWRLTEGTLSLTYENWHCPNPDSLSDVARCAKLAKEFVSTFAVQDSGTPVFEIVWRAPSEVGSERPPSEI